MHASPPHDTHEIVIAATLWLMHRYQQTGCSKLARMVEQHLRWMQMGATSTALAAACPAACHSNGARWHASPPPPSPLCIDSRKFP